MLCGVWTALNLSLADRTLREGVKHSTPEEASMPLLLVENQEKGPTVFGTHIWAPKGDEHNRDVLRLPDTMLDDPDFLDALSSGSLVVVNPTPEQSEQIGTLRVGEQTSARLARMDRAGVRIEETIARRQDRDMVAQECIGPGARGQEGACGSQVILTQKRGEEPEPPLCKGHQHLADQFAYVDAPAGRGTWARVAAR